MQGVSQRRAIRWGFPREPESQGCHGPCMWDHRVACELRLGPRGQRKPGLRRSKKVPASQARAPARKAPKTSTSASVGLRAEKSCEINTHRVKNKQNKNQFSELMAWSPNQKMHKLSHSSRPVSGSGPSLLSPPKRAAFYVILFLIYFYRFQRRRKREI